MNTMYNNNMFSNPFLNNSTDIIKMQLEQLLALVNKVQSATNTSLEEIAKTINSMTTEEQSLLTRNLEFLSAKLIYEAGFMDFLSSKFSNEYVTSANGKAAADNLLETIKVTKTKIANEILGRQEKVNMMLSLLEKDPDIKKKYDEMILNNGK